MNDKTEAQIEPVGLESIGECRVLRDVSQQPGIATVEGELIPLLTGGSIRAHSIKMAPGQYCFPHPHPTESIIYTVSGRWVFCTVEDGEEVRTVINANDLFHFVPDVATGFETPFDEGAEILILKGSAESYEELREGMLETKKHLDEEHEKGEPFYFSELDEGHPARVFGEKVSGRDPGAVGSQK